MLTDYIVVYNDYGFPIGFKRYKKHRFDENKTKIVFFDENKKPFLDRKGYLTSNEVKEKYTQFIES